jgi:hypothetical protein
MVDSVLETFIRRTRWSRQAGAWTAAFHCMSVPFLLSGAVRHVRARIDDETVDALLVGRPKRFRPLCARLLGCSVPVEIEGRRGLWPASTVTRSGAHLVAVEIHPWLAPKLRNEGWVIVPEAVRWRGAMTEVPPAVPSESLLADFRKIRRHSYEPEVVAGVTCWDEFEHEMVRPYALDRFADDVWLPTRAYMRFLARSTVVFVRRDGRRVAGASMMIRDGEGWLALVGVRDGDRRLMREGAIAAAYAFAIAWARENGARVLDIGRTSSFLHDGLGRYKAKWGFRAAPEPLSPLVAVRIAPGCAPLRRAFEREPVRTVDACGLALFDGGSAPRPLHP